jgi:hypothetical protein
MSRIMTAIDADPIACALHEGKLLAMRLMGGIAQDEYQSRIAAFDSAIRLRVTELIDRELMSPPEATRPANDPPYLSDRDRALRYPDNDPVPHPMVAEACCAEIDEVA